jgi:gluconokinase
MAPTTVSTRPVHLVVMGVSGCGKSTVARLCALELGLPFLEGDDHHPEHNVRKMRQGTPLNDDDRAGWLATLARLLQAHPHGAVLTCSALKRAYRDVLRAAQPGLGFAFLDISPAGANARVADRSGHFFSAALVRSQFDVLEPPVQEADVLWLSATQTVPMLVEQITGWARGTAP